MCRPVTGAIEVIGIATIRAISIAPTIALYHAVDVIILTGDPAIGKAGLAGHIPIDVIACLIYRTVGICL